MYRKYQEMADAKEEPQQQAETIVDKVSQLPLVASAYDMFSNYYNRAKEYNSLTKMTLDTAENSIKFAADQAKPIVSKLEKPIAYADSAACKTLDFVQEKCPVIAKTPEEIAKDTKEMYSTTIQPTVERVGALKEVGMEKVNAVKDFSYQKANEFMDTKYGQMIGTSVNKTLTVADQYIDYYLPANTEDKEDMKPLSNDVMVDKVNKLSIKLKNRVQSKSIQQLEQMQKRTQDTLSHLHVVLDLVQFAKANLNSTNVTVRDHMATAQTKVMLLWEELKKDETEIPTENVTMEQRSLVLARMLTKRLLNIYNNASQALPPVPESVQPAFTQTQNYVKELYSQVTKIKTMEDATTVVLTQVREKSKTIQDAVNGLLEYTAKLQPLEWLGSTNEDSAVSENKQQETVPNKKLKSK